MKSPCRAACKNNGGICSGCHRTIEEIVTWNTKTDQQREATIAKITGITATHACPSCDKQTFCGISAGEQTCWCFDVESRTFSIKEEKQACVCRQCLEKAPIE
ncbi:cysteine-rich CWC family protein [Vibrio sagamiensis]|uniref:DUF1289 domain-containing protein n=1 Tax=Vibrio sagamiensis NBRC 104589 TaxID=1219064 RepID=A0A511QGF6_9VIBR|nr:cysteine-rich CWC family protein [Vibrio sagamiensis]PNQ53965.1 DUF1289 domain-containing protein [Vibrio agarivorans]GEM76236.1 hypothetical protein VSA01S_23480 [Vibrio sagamiensis NBRC 104589]